MVKEKWKRESGRRKTKDERDTWMMMMRMKMRMVMGIPMLLLLPRLLSSSPPPPPPPPRIAGLSRRRPAQRDT
ncbi:hypothetical protein DV515_00001331 [Chloebia gouldiae]|uniref:Uncharacterized protein n=1 Tax=Chloebia gouldiae TaxID=44316 RepID=A0A3L8SXU9_CHLGU|nr:hypothetical protein DV515_00001331 [Chloebia gouldiae]